MLTEHLQAYGTCRTHSPALQETERHVSAVVSFQGDPNASAKRDQTAENHNSSPAERLCQRGPKEGTDRKGESRDCHRVGDLLVGNEEICLTVNSQKKSFELS